MSSRQRSSRPILTSALGTAVATAALVVALTLAGPALRRWFGSPVDFNQDYSSRSAVEQAFVAQESSLIAAFLLLGLAAKAWGSTNVLKWSLWAANPATIGVGYWLYRILESPPMPWEYFSYADWIVLSLLSPIILAPAAILGTHLRRQIVGGGQAT